MMRITRDAGFHDDVRVATQAGSDKVVMDRAGREQELENLLDELHVGHVRSSLGISLSGGERRRVEIARALAVSHDRHDEFLRLEAELDELLDTCAGNPYLQAALAPLRTHCRRFWYLHQDRLPLSEVITGLSSMVRLVARRDYNGALKASDAVMSVIERLAGETRLQEMTV